MLMKALQAVASVDVAKLELCLAGRMVKEGRPVLWHDINGFYLFMENTVL